MLAVEISRHGGPDVLVPVDRADPVPARGEVLVSNRWVGVNYVDLQHREGRPYPVTLPLVPGTEAAGTIVAAGPGVDAGLVGTPVVHFGHLAGVYAELTAVPLDYVVPLPPDTPLDVAAAVALSGTTAHVLTSAAHRVGPGDVVVVHAAAGATGGAVVQRAAAAGADVIAIASTAEKAAAATTLGAGHAVISCDLIAGWLAQAVLAALLALLLPPLGALLVVVFALALVDTPLAAAVGRCIPAVVADDDLVAANALRSGVRELGTVLGPPLAGLLFAVWGARLVLGLDALTFILVVPLVLGLPEPGPVPVPEPEPEPEDR